MYKLRKGDFFLLGAYSLVGGMDEFGSGCSSERVCLQVAHFMKWHRE